MVRVYPVHGPGPSQIVIGDPREDYAKTPNPEITRPVRHHSYFILYLIPYT